MNRCACILNRLSISADALPFLDNIPFTGDGVIYQPIIWLRMIHNRLHNKYYDNEFDFAYDIRLIFYSAFSSKSNELIINARQLSSLFEYLFTHWIINIQDRSVDEYAKGPWDDWNYVKFFDTSDVNNMTSNFIYCKDCKDVISAVENEDIVIPQSCNRCINASNFTVEELSKDPKVSIDSIHICNSEYNCENFGGLAFIPLQPDFTSR